LAPLSRRGSFFCPLPAGEAHQPGAHMRGNHGGAWRALREPAGGADLDHRLRTITGVTLKYPWGRQDPAIAYRQT
jgi:hypothetical protein